MIDASDNPRERIGGNSPPGPLDELVEETAAIKQRILDIRVALLKVPDVITPDDAGQVSDMLLQAQKALRQLDKTRVRLKKPFDDLADAVQKHCQSIGALIGTKTSGGLLTRIHRRHHEYQVAFEEDQKAAQASERTRVGGLADDAYRQASDLEERADAAARAATTDPQRRQAALLADQAHSVKEAADRLADKLADLEETDKAHIRGTGSLSYLVDRALGYEVTDAALVPRDYLSVDNAKVKAAINAGIEIDGIRVIRNRDTVVKG